jgi:hypothetical protein
VCVWVAVPPPAPPPRPPPPPTPLHENRTVAKGDYIYANVAGALTVPT